MKISAQVQPLRSLSETRTVHSLGEPGLPPSARLSDLTYDELFNLAQQLYRRQTDLEEENKKLRSQQGIPEPSLECGDQKLLQALYQISEATATTQDLPELYRLVHRVVARLIPASNFFIAVYEAATNTFSYPYHADELDMISPEKEFSLSEFKNLTAYVIRTGAPQLINQELLTYLVKSGKIMVNGAAPVSWLGVPLHDSQGSLMGVVAVQSYTPGHEYRQEDLEILSFISTQIANAIQRKKNEQSVFYRIMELTGGEEDMEGLEFLDLFDLSEIQQIQDSFSSAAGVASIIVDMFGRPITRPSNLSPLCSGFVTEAGPVDPLSPARGGPSFADYMGKELGLTDASTVILVGKKPVARWVVGQVLTREIPLEEQEANALRLGIEPRIYKQILAGVPHKKPEDFSQVARALFLMARLLSRQALQNIQQARKIAEIRHAEEKIRQQLQRLGALRAIDVAITNAQAPNGALQVLLEQVRQHLKADAADILIYNPENNQLEYAASYGFRFNQIQNIRLKVGKGLGGKAALNREMVLIEHISEEELAQPMAEFLRLSEENFVTYMAVPLLAKDELIGVMEIFQRSEFKPNFEWLDFMQSLASQASVALQNSRLVQNLKMANTRLVLAYDDTIQGWSRALEMRDMETEGHGERVTDMALSLAIKVGMKGEALIHLRRGALLHDIGKMSVPDHILFKPGPLTEEEWKIMRMHPDLGYNMLSPIDFLTPMLDVVRYHHEKWDGSGYPSGKKGEEIPLSARIFALIDVWDSLTHRRPYKPAWTAEMAEEYIRNEAGRHFDPAIAAVFLKYYPDWI